MPRARARTRVKKDAGVPQVIVTKSLPSGVPEGGVHVHMLEREFNRTKIDGAHFHIFPLPDGSFIQTAEDGAHSHPIESDGRFEWISAGEHSHAIPVGGGESMFTNSDGWHSHDAQTDSTAFDGVHQHALRLPDGSTVESLLPLQHYLLEGSRPQAGNGAAPPASMLAKARGTMDASLLVSKTGDVAILFDAVMPLLVRIEMAREDFSGTPDDFTAHGSAHFLPLTDVPAELTKWDGPGSMPEYVACGTGTVEPGLITSDQMELFLQIPGVEGVLRMVKGDDSWTVSLTVEAPSVLKCDADLPPQGCSALPASLEASVPTNMRYWESDKLTEAVTRRAWLTESDYFGHESEIGLVSGELRKMVVERALFSHVPEDVEKSEWVAEIGRLLPQDAEVVSPFASEDWLAVVKAHMSTETIIVLDVPEDVPVTPAELGTLTKGSRFLLGAPDTPEARSAFEKSGRPFKLRDPAAAGRLFVASFPCVSKSLFWAPPAAAGQPAPAEPTEAEKCAERVYKRIADCRIICDKAAEERFVYGVAMEPDETDTQGDMQKSETIRVAAHKFMEDFGNIGLQHTKNINGKVKILESSILRADTVIEGHKLRKGTWMFGVRVLDDGIWAAIKAGELTGFSIGGTAVRSPL